MQLVAQSCLTLQLHGLQPARLLCPWNSPGKNTGMDYHSLHQWIFLTQGLNPGLLHFRQSHYHLNHQESPTEFQTFPTFTSFGFVFFFPSCSFSAPGFSQGSHNTFSCASFDVFSLAFSFMALTLLMRNDWLLYRMCPKLSLFDVSSRSE